MVAHSGTQRALNRAQPASGFRRRPEHIPYGRVLGNIHGGSPVFGLQLRICTLRQQRRDNLCVPLIGCDEKGGCTVADLPIERRAVCQQRFYDRAVTIQ